MKPTLTYLSVERPTRLQEMLPRFLYDTSSIQDRLVQGPSKVPPKEATYLCEGQLAIKAFMAD